MTEETKRKTRKATIPRIKLPYVKQKKHTERWNKT